MLYIYFLLIFYRIFLSSILICFDKSRNIVFPSSEDSKNTTLFIVGCGSSLNDLTANEIKFINHSDSIGINLIVLHKQLEPRYLSIEVSENSSNYIKDNNSKIYSRVLNEKACNNKNLKFIINTDNFKSIKKLIPNIFELGEVNLIRQVNLPGNGVYFRRINKYIKFWFFKKLLLPRITLGKNASIISFVYLGILRGYKDIVLCGIDLSTRYFWEDDPDNYPESSSIMNMHFQKNHNTEMTALPVSHVLDIINQSNPDINIWITSPKSHLANRLPIYKFNE